MKKITRNETGILEIFTFAKETKGIDWNKANHIFLRSNILPFKGIRDLELGELEVSLEYATEEQDKTAYKILINFLNHHDVKTARYYGDGN